MNDSINSELYRNLTHRTEMVLGTSSMKEISGSKVIIFGVGGVGSWCAESLVRSGILHLTIVDSDIICATNINRQIQANSHNIGNSKAAEIGKRLKEINPLSDITVRHSVYDETTSESFNLSSYDYVIDAIDSIKNKVHLIEQCVNSDVTIFSSMGAAAKNDPSKIKTALLSSTKVCPLARNVRRGLRQKNISTDIICVYSEETPVKPAIESFCGSGICGCKCDREKFSSITGSESVDWCAAKKRINGALVHITAVFGFFLAGLVINDIVKKSCNLA